eukprot:Protomagalhaensia_wolfi_Nauph_80__4307@NODE_43_length_4308_cov_97_382759_g35_i0_p5_GENE_NODE_43_length_4308_cov_97_382759_g35_i0NODE_43_length_4308_cov_97_382759_g35_i0_p5_ORF_typecomplete_len126_score17_28Ubie_methyltran/PF01209_18/0_0029Methyltransf_31/PF13847_6/0_0064Methyltransf_23/PF13489_6/0_012MetW/PF07021_12/0_16MTS/PF05175_14/0_16PrmA/PF06325_13/0_3_NODE_43_length_4308_cov_97_382759_g35_i032863663
MTENSRERNIRAMLQTFNNGEDYDAKKWVHTITDAFAISILNFDVLAPRKSWAESDPLLDSATVARQMTSLPPPGVLPQRLIKPGTRLIDFACGTGLVASRLAPYMANGEIVGIVVIFWTPGVKV